MEAGGLPVEPGESPVEPLNKPPALLRVTLGTDNSPGSMGNLPACKGNSPAFWTVWTPGGLPRMSHASMALLATGLGFPGLATQVPGVTRRVSPGSRRVGAGKRVTSPLCNTTGSLWENRLCVTGALACERY